MDEAEGQHERSHRSFHGVASSRSIPIFGRRDALKSFSVSRNGDCVASCQGFRHRPMVE